MLAGLVGKVLAYERKILCFRGLRDVVAVASL